LGSTKASRQRRVIAVKSEQLSSEDVHSWPDIARKLDDICSIVVYNLFVCPFLLVLVVTVSFNLEEFDVLRLDVRVRDGSEIVGPGISIAASLVLRHERLAERTGPLCIRIIPLQWTTTSDPARATALRGGYLGSVPPSHHYIRMAQPRTQRQENLQVMPGFKTIVLACHGPGCPDVPMLLV
jgi:hypothetical protein